jgi:transcriptional regulator GlxA family with amidase domain
MNQKQLPTVGILIFDEVEVLDFCGPFEVFSVARPVGENSDELKLFTVVTIAEEDRIVTCRGGLLVKPHATFENHPPLDILVAPGGQGTRRERHNHRLLDWIAQQDQNTNLTTSVCTGAFLLAERGLLDHHRATTHWNSVEWMRGTYPNIEMVADERIVDEGIRTSAQNGIKNSERTVAQSLLPLSFMHSTSASRGTDAIRAVSAHAGGEVRRLGLAPAGVTERDTSADYVP